MCWPGRAAQCELHLPGALLQHPSDLPWGGTNGQGHLPFAAQQGRGSGRADFARCAQTRTPDCSESIFCSFLCPRKCESSSRVNALINGLRVINNPAFPKPVFVAVVSHHVAKCTGDYFFCKSPPPLPQPGALSQVPRQFAAPGPSSPPHQHRGALSRAELCTPAPPGPTASGKICMSHFPFCL